MKSAQSGGRGMWGLGSLKACFTGCRAGALSQGFARVPVRVPKRVLIRIVVLTSVGGFTHYLEVLLGHLIVTGADYRYAKHMCHPPPPKKKTTK